MEKISGVYLITHIESKKIYVGSSIDISRRWKEHINHLNLNKHENPKLQNAWNKYGEDAFRFEILEKVEPIKEKILSIEQIYLDRYQSYKRELGFNLYKTAGSPQGTQWDEEQKARLSETRKNQFKVEEGHFKGKKHSLGTREAMHKVHEERYKKLQEEGKVPPQTGYKHTIAARNKMIEANKDRVLPKNFAENVRKRRLETKLVNGHWVHPI
jgi:group I intron endonuclease